MLTLVQEAEKHQSWSEGIAARNFQPTDVLGFHYVNTAGENWRAASLQKILIVQL